MYTVTSGHQAIVLDEHALGRGDSFDGERTRTETLKHAEISQVKYDLVGKIAEGAKITRRSAAAILARIAPPVFACFRQNPEEFIGKAVKLIQEQKAAMVIEHISYDRTQQVYDSTIFTATKRPDLGKAFKAEKHIQDYVFTDGTAEESNEQRFAKELDKADEVCVYAKLPRGFSIPTPVGNYTPDWAIAFNKGTVKHIYFVAETKGGTMESMSFNLRPIEQAKIACAKRLFNELSTEDVVYHEVDSYQTLLNIMNVL